MSLVCSFIFYYSCLSFSISSFSWIFSCSAYLRISLVLRMTKYSPWFSWEISKFFLLIFINSLYASFYDLLNSRIREGYSLVGDWLALWIMPLNFSCIASLILAFSTSTFFCLLRLAFGLSWIIFYNEFTSRVTDFLGGDLTLVG